MKKPNIKKIRKSLKKWLLHRVDLKLPLPKNKVGIWLNKDVPVMPKYFKDSYRELKKVTWPTRGETAKLMLAVIIFTAILTAIIALSDFFFEKLITRILPN